MQEKGRLWYAWAVAALVFFCFCPSGSLTADPRLGSSVPGFEIREVAGPAPYADLLNSCAIHVVALPVHWHVATQEGDVKSVEITIRYDPKSVPVGIEEKRLALWRYEGGAGWSPVQTLADPVGHKVIGRYHGGAGLLVLGAAVPQPPCAPTNLRINS